MNIRGRIIKGIGGFYYVSDAAGKIYECKARGRFRREGASPCVGDYVDFVPLAQGYASIEEILPRKNRLVRPQVANIDSIILVLSAGKPAVDFLLCDKLLIQADCMGVHPIVAINKTDVGEQWALKISEQYSCYDTIYVSALKGEGIQDLKDIVRNKCVCFAGQSAVGKSSLINALGRGFELETGELSKKTERGKHTTRQAELLYLEDANAYIVDTPGFSMFDMRDIPKEELQQYYREMQKYIGQCRFVSSCLHDKEPGCAVKKAVESGEINKDRYERYLKLLHIMGEKHYD